MIEALLSILSYHVKNIHGKHQTG